MEIEKIVKNLNAAFETVVDLVDVTPDGMIHNYRESGISIKISWNLEDTQPSVNEASIIRALMNAADLCESDAKMIFQSDHYGEQMNELFIAVYKAGARL